MPAQILKLWKPEVYQGHNRKGNYFEGWYIKLTNFSGDCVYALIPGISKGGDGQDHSFIQVLNGKTAEAFYVDFPMNSFKWSDDDFKVSIEGNVFSGKGIDLNISHPKITIRGKVAFSDLSGWPVSLFSPGAMGWYAFTPFMECYHGVVSFDHQLSGSLVINSQEVDFEKGRGYIEKDWGRSFPEYYIWIQSNHFDVPGTSLMSSMARIPWMGSSFDGFLCGFLHEGKLYRFATYTGAKITRLRMEDHRVIIHYSDKRHRIEITATRNDHHAELKSPLSGRMSERIRESLTSVVNVRLFDKSGKTEKVIFEGSGKHTGLEMGGKTDLLKEVGS